MEFPNFSSADFRGFLVHLYHRQPDVIGENIGYMFPSELLHQIKIINIISWDASISTGFQMKNYSSGSSSFSGISLFL